MLGSCFECTNFTVANFILYKLLQFRLTRINVILRVFFQQSSKAVQMLLSEVQANNIHADVYQL